jgi:hypothetical protein
MDIQNPEQQAIPYQLEVYFAEFPEIDPHRLARFINECDPDEPDACTIEIATDPERVRGGTECDDLRIHGLTATMGEFSMAIALHGVPSPAIWVIEESGLPTASREELGRHKAFALLGNVGGKQYAPYENMIFLYKMALGLCQQGALGLGNPWTGMCFPKELLLGLLAAHSEPASEGDEPRTLWKTVREEGQPFELFAQIGSAQAGGRHWLLTRGFAHCGFPDFLYAPEAGEDLEEITEFFQNAFSYLMLRGPVIAPGHTMGYDENLSFRFDTPPADLKFPFATHDLLRVTRAGQKQDKMLELS